MLLHAQPLFCSGPPPAGPSIALNAICGVCLEMDTVCFDHRTDLLLCTYCGSTMIPHHTDNYVRASRKLHLPRAFSDNFYKRVCHFRAWLKRIQGIEKNKITAADIATIKEHFRKENHKTVHYWNVRNTLRELHMNKYYSHTVFIMSQLRGCPLVRMERNQEQLLVQDFMQLQETFNSVQHRRVNMLSYPFLIKKLCELRGWMQMAETIPTLKSSTRILLQDELWKIICEQKNWPFIPTRQWSALETHSLSSRPR